MNLPRINPESILLGIRQERSHDFVLKNHPLLMFKRYIYLNEDSKNALSIGGLKGFIRVFPRPLRHERGICPPPIWWDKCIGENVNGGTHEGGHSHYGGGLTLIDYITN